VPLAANGTPPWCKKGRAKAIRAEFHQGAKMGAETVLVMAGSFSTKGKAAVNRWREKGRKVGLVLLRLIRPQAAGQLA
jgi:pyruvate/2-oxoacid:ferredoxin oxidoreductase alpha subunit